VPTSISIRRAMLADLAALLPLAEGIVARHVAFDAARYQHPPDVRAAYTELFTTHLADANSVIVVAEDDGIVIGYCFGEIAAPSLVELTGRHGKIHDLFVAPNARRGGVGGRMLDAAIDALRALGCPGGVLLGVAAQNTAAAALFRSRGFRPTLQEMTLGPP
jgi:ribosomal protein S18 acetylase RimI-like enzyme